MNGSFLFARLTALARHAWVGLIEYVPANVGNLSIVSIPVGATGLMTQVTSVPGTRHHDTAGGIITFGAVSCAHSDIANL